MISLPLLAEGKKLLWLVYAVSLTVFLFSAAGSVEVGGQPQSDTVPAPVRSILSAAFVYDAQLTEEIRTLTAHLAQTTELQAHVQYWVFSHPGSVEEAAAALDTTAQPMFSAEKHARLDAIFAAFLHTWHDALLDLKGAAWVQEAAEKAGHWYSHTQTVKELRFILEAAPSSPATGTAGVPVYVRPLLQGENVSEWSAGIVTAPGGDPIAGYLQTTPEGDRLAGWFEPGTYEAYIIFQREDTSAWSEDPVVLQAAADNDGVLTVDLEVWWLPFAFPWSLSDITDAARYEEQWAAELNGPDEGRWTFLLSAPNIDWERLTITEETQLTIRYVSDVQ